MAAGKASVVSTADHASELIEDGLSGYLVDPLDKECIVERTSRLLSSPDLAREMGRRGSLSVAARDVSYSAEMFMTALRSVLRRRASGKTRRVCHDS
jgi:glycosyltransferase involved in cell wall biosynthesis